MSWWVLLVACSSSGTADRWLDTVARGDDAEALASLDVGEPPPGGFDVGRFGKRAERVGLRGATDVDWTVQTRSGLRVHLEGTFGADGRTIALDVFSGRIRNVVVADVPLVPVQSYVVIPDDQPVGELVIPDLRARPGRTGLDVGGTTDTAGTLTVNARCLADGRWVANAMMGQVHGPFTLTVAVLEGTPCQLRLRFQDGATRRDGVFCTDPIRPGPCEPAPDATGPEVEASAIRARWSSGGISIDYRLRANVPQPEAGGFAFAVVTTTLTCPGGKRPVTHDRPLTSDWLEPGVDRVLGSPMAVHAEGRPCGLRLDYVRDDHYDRVELPLFSGCVDADGTVRPGPC